MIKGSRATGLHQLNFRNYAMVLSHSQLELLALTLDVKRASAQDLATHFTRVLPRTMNHFVRVVMHDALEMNTALRRQPCAWNMLLNRRCGSPANKVTLSSLFEFALSLESNGARARLRYSVVPLLKSNRTSLTVWTTSQLTLRIDRDSPRLLRRRFMWYGG